jgi:S-(hydroxymethyl)glutathione dehydrogenase/alcohol dehydrogenase
VKAAVFTGDSPTLTIEDLERPSPGRGEVLVQVAACGVCHTDLHVLKKEVAFPTPAVLGHEVSGTVAEVGADVVGIAVGDRVVCSFIMPCGTCRHCVRGYEDLCETFFAYNRLKGTLYDGTTRLSRADGSPVSMYSMGGLAEFCVVPATDVFQVPDDVDLADVSIVGCSSFTAYGAVRNVARLDMSDKVAVIAAGGVGSSIIQFAKAVGVGQIIAVDVSAEKLDAAKALGATDVVNSSVEDAAARVIELSGGKGVDVAFEALGHASTFALALDVLDDGGRAVVVGIAPAGSRGDVDLARLVRRKLSILGSYGARARADMPQLINLVRQGVVRPKDVITRRYSLAEADEAYQALARGEIVGRAVIEMS